MKRSLLFLIFWMSFVFPVLAQGVFTTNVYYDSKNPYATKWYNNGAERWTYLEDYSTDYRLIDRGTGTLKLTRSVDFDAAICGSLSYSSDCIDLQTVQESSSYSVSFREVQSAFPEGYYLLVGKKEQEPQEPLPTPGGGGGNVGDKLPDYNLMDDPVLSATFWNYLGSVMKLGLPFLLIVVALIVVDYVTELIINAIRSKRSKYHDDDDDW